MLTDDERSESAANGEHTVCSFLEAADVDDPDEVDTPDAVVNAIVAILHYAHREGADVASVVEEVNEMYLDEAAL